MQPCIREGYSRLPGRSRVGRSFPSIVTAWTGRPLTALRRGRFGYFIFGTDLFLQIMARVFVVYVCAAAVSTLQQYYCSIQLNCEDMHLPVIVPQSLMPSLPAYQVPRIVPGTCMPGAGYESLQYYSTVTVAPAYRA